MSPRPSRPVPPTPEQRLEEEQAVVRAKLLEHRNVDTNIDRAVELKIPIAEIARLTGLTRQTIHNRRRNDQQPSDELEPGSRSQ